MAVVVARFDDEARVSVALARLRSAGFARRDIGEVPLGEQMVGEDQVQVEVRVPDDRADEAADLLARAGAIGVETADEPQDGRNRGEVDEPPRSLWRHHYVRTFEPSGQGFERLEPAYRYGQALATEDEFIDEEWDAIEPHARRQWEAREDRSWEEVRGAIEQGFMIARFDV